MIICATGGYLPNSAQPLAPTADPVTAAIGYQAWGWPVTLHHGQVRLGLDTEHVAALIVPAGLATAIAAALTARRCPVPVLARPDAPRHRILLAGECPGVRLPWPPEVRRATGTMLLPPTPTPRGPLVWHHPPRPNSLRMCREVDILVALRGAQRGLGRSATSAAFAEQDQPVARGH